MERDRIGACGWSFTRAPDSGGRRPIREVVEQPRRLRSARPTLRRGRATALPAHRGLTLPAARRKAFGQKSPRGTPGHRHSQTKKSRRPGVPLPSPAALQQPAKRTSLKNQLGPKGPRERCSTCPLNLPQPRRLSTSRRHATFGASTMGPGGPVLNMHRFPTTPAFSATGCAQVIARMVTITGSQVGSSRRSNRRIRCAAYRAGAAAAAGAAGAAPAALPPMKARRSALMVSAWVVGMPCGKPL